MNFTVQYRPRVERDIERLPRGVLELVDRKLRLLGETPRPSGCKKLKGAGLWRVRVGDYRIVYEVDDARKIVDVHIVAHRRDVYRGL
jgi:mRNA interferase RelE/StbE